jgi:hypothetical protein
MFTFLKKKKRNEEKNEDEKFVEKLLDVAQNFNVSCCCYQEYYIEFDSHCPKKPDLSPEELKFFLDAEYNGSCKKEIKLSTELIDSIDYLLNSCTCSKKLLQETKGKGKGKGKKKMTYSIKEIKFIILKFLAEILHCHFYKYKNNRNSKKKYENTDYYQNLICMMLQQPSWLQCLYHSNLSAQSGGDENYNHLFFLLTVATNPSNEIQEILFNDDKIKVPVDYRIIGRVVDFINETGSTKFYSTEIAQYCYSDYLTKMTVSIAKYVDPYFCNVIEATTEEKKNTDDAENQTCAHLRKFYRDERYNYHLLRHSRMLNCLYILNNFQFTDVNNVSNNSKLNFLLPELNKIIVSY